LPDSAELGDYVFLQCDALLHKAALAGFDSVELYLRDRYKSITQKKLVLRLLRMYNKAVNNADGSEVEKHATALALFPTDDSGSLAVDLFLHTMTTEAKKHAVALANFPTDNSTFQDIGIFLHTMSTEAKKHAVALANFPTDNSTTLDVGLFLQTMNASGGNGIEGLVGYILKFV